MSFSITPLRHHDPIGNLISDFGWYFAGLITPLLFSQRMKILGLFNNHAICYGVLIVPILVTMTLSTLSLFNVSSNWSQYGVLFSFIFVVELYLGHKITLLITNLIKNILYKKLS